MTLNDILEMILNTKISLDILGNNKTFFKKLRIETSKHNILIKFGIFIKNFVGKQITLFTSDKLWVQLADIAKEMFKECLKYDSQTKKIKIDDKLRLLDSSFNSWSTFEDYEYFIDKNIYLLIKKKINE